jgi:hypothetical protein
VIVRALTFAAATLAALAAATAAGASNGKQRIVVERIVDEYSSVVVTDCAAYGPYDFFIEATGTFRASIVDVLADDGSLLQTVFHFSLDETEANSVSGRSLPLHGVIHEVWDYGSNTRTVVGVAYIGTERGAGTYLQDTGRITMTLDTHVAQFVAGPHEVFFGGGIETVLCAALAGA